MSTRGAKRIDFSKLPFGTEVRRRDGEVVKLVEARPDDPIWRIKWQTANGTWSLCDSFGHYMFSEGENAFDLVSVVSDEDAKPHTADSALLAAAEKVLACWESGDLAGAVRELDQAVREAKGANT